VNAAPDLQLAPATGTPSWFGMLDIDAQRAVVDRVSPPAPVVPPPAPKRPHGQKPAGTLRTELRFFFGARFGLAPAMAADMADAFCAHFAGEALYVPKGLPDADALLAERDLMIVAAVAAGGSLRQVGRTFGMSATHVRRIVAEARAAAA
jgi:Mor transcription activator family